MTPQVEELPDNKVRLTVEVPQADLQHAVEHATHDLAEAVKVPGFRKGKVPPQVLEARIGRERIFTEAVESHIGGWFMNAAATHEHPPGRRARVRLRAAELRRRRLPVHRHRRGPAEARAGRLVDSSRCPTPSPRCRRSSSSKSSRRCASRSPSSPPSRTGPRTRATCWSSTRSTRTGRAQRDLVVELGSGRLVEEIERALTGAASGETKEVEFESVDGSTAKATVEVKEIKEKVLPPLDDELARAASEFDTLAELRADLEQRMHDVLEEEAETQFRAAAVDTLVEASNVQVGGPLVEARTRELLNGLGRSLESRGISAEAYFQLSGQTAEQLVQRMTQEAALSVARELVLEAVADKLELEVSDEEIGELIREQAEIAGDDPDEAVKQVFDSGREEVLRADLRLRKALDRVAAESKRIPAEVARAREEIWTPDKESQPTETKLWTPGSKEPA